MVLEPLTENVTVLTITPFLQLELLPSGEEGWGVKTNNNWIRLENSFQGLSEEITVTRQTVESIDQGLDDTLSSFQSQIDNEAIERSAADAALQAQIPPNISVNARFSGRPMTAGAGSAFTHNLGKLCSVTVIRETGSGGIDVTGAFDTLITHNSANQVTVKVGITGSYTILCVA